LRFLASFEKWIQENTRGVLILQIRDRTAGGWEVPYVSDDITDHITKPFLLLQHNWFKMMEFFQNDMLNYYTTHSGHKVYKIAFQYVSDKEENKAALNFHLTRREEKDITRSIHSVTNQRSFGQLMNLLTGTEKDSFMQVE
jgi:hypothetical protein